MLTIDEREALPGLIADAVDDDGARLILCDILADVDTGLEMSLRYSCSLHALIRACRHAGQGGRVAAAKCRAQLKGWARAVFDDRAGRTPNEGPEWERLPVGLGYGPTFREAEGSGRYRDWVIKRHLHMHAALCSYSHCYRLVERAFRGLDVPPDVQEWTAIYVEAIRDALRDLGTVNLEREVS